MFRPIYEPWLDKTRRYATKKDLEGSMLHLPILYLYLKAGISINTNRDDGFKTTQRVANPWYLLMLLLLLLLNVYSGKWAWLQLANKYLNKHNILKNPNCREEDQLTICKDDWRVERDSTWREITGFVVRAGLEPATPGHVQAGVRLTNLRCCLH